MFRSVRLALIGLLVFWLASQAAQAATGTAVGVNPQAQSQLDQVVKVLTVGADVAIGERIVTGEHGTVQIKFDDGTELVVGPNSALVIEDYLLRADNSAGKLAINALTGTFRFTTGLAPKDRYLIKTPTGTIGVRGTALDFNVDEEGTEVLVFHGAVIICNLSGTCVTLDGSCSVGQYDLAEAEVLGPSTELDQATRDLLRDQFPFATDESMLLPSFWIAQARDCLNAKVENTPVSSLSDSTNSDAPTIPPVTEPEEECDCEEEECSE